MTSYKVLGDSQYSYYGGDGKWVKNRWRTVEGPLVPCENGIHYCRRDQLVEWLGPTIWVFEDGSPDETIDHGDKMVTRKGRVIERLELWNETMARLFAADVAEAVLGFIPEAHREPFVTAISAARGFARGEISAEERYAARAAAWEARTAAWTAAGDAARYAARAAAGDAAYAARAAAGASAGDAARGAARDAAWGAAREAQTELLFQYLSGGRR